MMKATSEILRSLGITSPTVVIDEARAKVNIRRIFERSRQDNVAFRPHFKTHQCAEVGRWFAEVGVDRITVSSVEMAEYFADHGWKDITLAFLLNPLEAPRLRALAEKLHDLGGALGVTIDSTAATREIPRCGPVQTWIKIDTGYGRSGVRWNANEELTAVYAASSAPPQGLLTHAGHAYAARGTAAVCAIYDETVERLQHAREAIGAVADSSTLKLSLGDTPTCSLAKSFAGIDEIRPGNFVFNDLMQLQIGSCGPGDLAAATACPVVAVYPQKRRIVIHGGAVHHSKESLNWPNLGSVYGFLGTIRTEGDPAFGRILEQAPLISLSQEHGTVELSESEFEIFGTDLQVGDLVLVWPVHSCLTCNLQREFLTLGGERLIR